MTITYHHHSKLGDTLVQPEVSSMLVFDFHCRLSSSNTATTTRHRCGQPLTPKHTSHRALELRAFWPQLRRVHRSRNFSLQAGKVIVPRCPSAPPPNAAAGKASWRRGVHCACPCRAKPSNVFNFMSSKRGAYNQSDSRPVHSNTCQTSRIEVCGELTHCNNGIASDECTCAKKSRKNDLWQTSSFAAVHPPKSSHIIGSLQLETLSKSEQQPGAERPRVVVQAQMCDTLRVDGAGISNGFVTLTVVFAEQELEGMLARHAPTLLPQQIAPVPLMRTQPHIQQNRKFYTYLTLASHVPRLQCRHN